MNLREKISKWMTPTPKVNIDLNPKPIQLAPDQTQRLVRAIKRHERVLAALNKGDRRMDLRKEKQKLEHLIEVLK